MIMLINIIKKMMMKNIWKLCIICMKNTNLLWNMKQNRQWLCKPFLITLLITIIITHHYLIIDNNNMLLIHMELLILTLRYIWYKILIYILSLDFVSKHEFIHSTGKIPNSIVLSSDYSSRLSISEVILSGCYKYSWSNFTSINQQ